MPATIRIYEFGTATPAAGAMRRGSAEVANGVLNTDYKVASGQTVRFKQALSVAVDANNPIPIPAAGTNRSMPKFLTFNLWNSEAGDATTVSNLRFYTSGTNPWTGVDIFGAAINAQWAANLTASLAVGQLANPNSSADFATAGVVSIFTRTAALPLDMDANDQGPVAPAGWVESNGMDTFHIGDLLYMQMDVTSTASAGTLAGATGTFVYDET